MDACPAACRRSERDEREEETNEKKGARGRGGGMVRDDKTTHPYVYFLYNIETPLLIAQRW